mmetsp:Transcript_13213/g.24734  ORF Transcript_13213/g.24734 Transcript_13213/m.24734 type:complete len:440 (-) Transcript_13213:4-1323(-)
MAMWPVLAQVYPQPFTMQDFAQIDEAFLHGDSCLLATYSVRKLLERADYAETLTAFIPKLVWCLQRTDFPQLQYEAAWALSFFASYSTAIVGKVVEAGALHHLKSLLASSDDRLIDIAALVYGNIAGDCEAARDAVIVLDGHMHLIEAAKHSGQVSEVNVCWALCNILRHKVLPSEDAIKIIVPLITTAFIQANKDEVLSNTLWALTYVSRNEDCRQLIESQPVLHKLCLCLTHIDIQIKHVAVQTLGNLTVTSDTVADEIIYTGGLFYLKQILPSSDKIFKADILWLLSNFAAGTVGQAAALFKYCMIDSVIEAGMSGVLVHLKNACYVLGNLPDKVSVDQLIYVVSLGGFKLFSRGIQTSGETMQVSVEGMTAYLSAGKAYDANPFIEALREAGAVEALIICARSSEVRAAQLAQGIMKEYFTEEEICQAMNLVRLD